MKTTTALTTLTVALTLAVATVAPAQQGPNGPAAIGQCRQVLSDHLALLPVGNLDDGETEAVLYLREEEKLARDVYLVLSLYWEHPVFINIARSEQRHMDLVAVLLDRYGLTDPVVDDQVGVFSDPQLQSLYYDLVAAGQVSLLDALVVGATIEDLDLADLKAMILDGNDLDVDLIAENLAAGSRNHLRAFVGAITKLGGVYAPQYLDQATYTAVVTSDPERGIVYDEFGEILAECGQANGDTGGCGGHNGNGDGGGNGDCDGGSGGGRGGNGDCDGSGPNGN